MDTYLTYFDMVRYIGGYLAVIVMLCYGILPPRSHIKLRLFLCISVISAAALGYVPLSRLVLRQGIDLLYASVVYWMVMSLFPAVFIRICWQACSAGIWFRVILCASAENFMTAVSYYFFYKSLFPSALAEQPAFLILGVIFLYAFMLVAGWYFLRPQVKMDENNLYQDSPKTAGAYIWTYISIIFLFSATKLCFESIIPPLADSEDYAGIYTFLKYYLTFTLLLLSVAISFIIINAYRTMTLQNEKQVITQMMKDRQVQYEFARENNEAIKQMAHDLKHQLRAIERISNEEYQKRRASAEKTIELYDAVVKTGNEALDTILTEKNIYCKNRGIRLSCTVNSRLLERIGVVDLYTLLGNAVDNSIEAVEKLSEPEKKTISLTIRDQDQMLYILLENYYEGSIQIEDGIPHTSKEDEQVHGYGTKSIRSIVKNYDGVMVIRTEKQIYSLEILIPT